MKPLRITITVLMLLVFAPVSVLAPGFRHCVGPDGHSAIEFVKGGHHADEERARVRDTSITIAHPGHCIDRPLIAAFKEAQTLDVVRTAKPIFLPALIASTRQAAPDLRSRQPEASPGREIAEAEIDPRLAPLKTVVLRL